HDRRGGASSFGVGDDDRVAPLHDRDDRVGRAEVDADDLRGHGELLNWVNGQRSTVNGWVQRWPGYRAACSQRAYRRSLSFWQQIGRSGGDPEGRSAAGADMGPLALVRPAVRLAPEWPCRP